MIKSLGPYIDSEVERLTSNIINQAVREKIKGYNIALSLIDHDLPSGGSHLSFNVEEINEFKEDITNHIQNVLTHLDKANIKDNYLFNQLHSSKYSKIKNGILAENSINSLRGSIIFGNIGPSIPLRLFFVGQVYSDIEIKTKEYGINNILVEIYLIITVKEQVMMPLTSKIKTIKIKQLLGADIVRGTIPNYYTGFSK